MINGEGRTALKLLVEKRTRGAAQNDL
jgi:hypothetical protein